MLKCNRLPCLFILNMNVMREGGWEKLVHKISPECNEDWGGVGWEKLVCTKYQLQSGFSLVPRFRQHEIRAAMQATNAAA